jgi:hypothetical protein
MSEKVSESTKELVTRYLDSIGIVWEVRPIHALERCYTIKCQRLATLEVIKGKGFPRKRQLKCDICFRRTFRDARLVKLSLDAVD